MIDTSDDSTHHIEADKVILAMGFTQAEEQQFAELSPGVSGVKINNGRILETDKEKNTVPIFSAGDCARGQSLVVWAIAEGRAVAKRIHEHLSE